MCNTVRIVRIVVKVCIMISQVLKGLSLATLRPNPHVTVFNGKRRFFSGMAFHPHVPVKMVTERAYLQKRSPEWRFLKTPFCCVRMEG